jgi:hypothetical protein
MLYTEFFAVLSLVFYAIENPEKPGSAEVLADARAGRQMIADLADKSLSADKVTNALKVCLVAALDPAVGYLLCTNITSGLIRSAPRQT